MSDTVPPKALVLRTWAFFSCVVKASIHRLHQAQGWQPSGTDAIALARLTLRSVGKAALYLKWHASRSGDPLVQERQAGFWLRLARISESHAAQAAPLGGEATSPAAQAAQPARRSPQTSRPKDGTVSDVAVVVRGKRN